MNSLKLRHLAAVAALATAAGATHAADSQNMTVQATVSSTCRLVTPLPTMSFTLDPAVGTDQTAPATVQYRCTKGTAPNGTNAFTVAGANTGTYTSGTTAGTGAMVGQTAGNIDVLPFKITWTAPSTAGSGFGSSVTPVDVVLTGTVLGTDYVNVTADTYKKTIAIAINP